INAGGESAWPAEHSQPLPLASGRAARLGKLRPIQAGVGSDEQIELAIAVIINECATSTPCTIACNPGKFRDLLKGPVTPVAVEPVFPEGGHKEIGPAVIIYVADAHSLAPSAGAGQSSARSNIRERTVVIIVVQMIRWLLAVRRRQRGAIDNEDVRPAVVVV